MKKALITGIAGQDGSYLAELLLQKGYQVFGLIRKGADVKYVPDQVQIIVGDLIDVDSIKAAVAESRPDEVYNLAAVTYLKQAYEFPEMTWKVNYEAVGVLLEECLNINPRVRFLQASSSEIFFPSKTFLNEESSRDWQTENPYAKAKMYADRDFIIKYRTEKKVFACSAIMFNHESPRRPEKNVLRKICRTLAQIKVGQAPCLSIGNVEMRRDWGFAGDDVLAMWKMLQYDTPEDFVIATGELHTVQQAIDITAHALDIKLTWQGTGVNIHACDPQGKKIVETVAEFYKPNEAYPKVGDARRVKSAMDWKPKVDFHSLIEMMVQAELDQFTHLRH